MIKRNRVLTVLLAAAVLFVMFSSACYIAIEAGHDCVGENCRICFRIGICENTLKSAGQAVIAALRIVFAGIFTVSLLVFPRKTACHTSLVSLKVKLSN